MRSRWLTALLAVALVAAALSWLVRPAASAGEDKTKSDLNSLKIFAYPGGATGIFDPATGKLYVYDTNLDKCTMKRQLDKLGEPLKVVK
jgi:hypothetical protein